MCAYYLLLFHAAVKCKLDTDRVREKDILQDLYIISFLNKGHIVKINQYRPCMDADDISQKLALVMTRLHSLTRTFCNDTVMGYKWLV